MGHVFISYAREDRALAEALAASLEERGLETWWDRELQAGQLLHETLSNALDASACVVVLWSNASIKSSWVVDEATEGRERDILVPCCVDETRPPLGFRGHLTLPIDARSPARAWDGIGEAVRAVLAGRPRRVRSRVEAARVSADRIRGALRRRLFDEAPVTLEQVYTDQKALLVVNRPEERKSDLSVDRWAREAIADWLHDAAAGDQGDRPLLVFGSFGAGKSSLLTRASLDLLSSPLNLVPLLVPLRDLRAPPGRRLGDVLVDYVRRIWGVDLATPDRPGDPRYCLLCDGFDELNLSYQGDDAQSWVRQCFLELRRLAARTDLLMVIATRPVLFMDISRPGAFEAGDCPRVELQLFDFDQVDAWCARYREFAKLEHPMDAAWLGQRGLFPAVRTPLILYMTARLVADEPEVFAESKVYSRADLYARFVDWTCRTGGYYREGEKHRLPSSYRQVLRQMAWIVFRSGRPVVAEEELLAELRADYGASVERVPVDRNLVVAHLLQPAGEDEEGRHLLEFTHQSFREFLVAEHVWLALADVRRGDRLEPAVWDRLARRPYGQAEVELLLDMVDQCSPEEAAGLAKRLGDAANVHAYWSTWLSEPLERLLEEDPARVPPRVALQAMRSIYMATLAYLLRIRALDRLVRTGRDAEPSDRYATQLRNLCRYSDTFVREKGISGDARVVLLANLERIRLPPGADLTRLHLEAMVCSHASLAGVDLRGATLRATVAAEANFDGADFARAEFRPAMTRGATFRGANFSQATLGPMEGAELDGGDFTGASFRGARLVDLAASGLVLVGNDWSAAWFDRTDAATEPYLDRCRLDHAAHQVLSSAGVELRDCSVVAEASPDVQVPGR